MLSSYFSFTEKSNFQLKADLLSDFSLAVVDLSYVGFPLAFEFEIKGSLVGFDINSKPLAELQNFIDTTMETKHIELLIAIHLDLYKVSLALRS